MAGGEGRDHNSAANGVEASNHIRRLRCVIRLVLACGSPPMRLAEVEAAMPALLSPPLDARVRQTGKRIQHTATAEDLSLYLQAGGISMTTNNSSIFAFAFAFNFVLRHECSGQAPLRLPRPAVPSYSRSR